MNLGDLRAHAKHRYRDMSGIEVADVTWTNFLNDAYTDVLGASPFWPFMEARSIALVIPAAGDNDVALPAGVGRVLSVFNTTDNYALEELVGRSPFDAYPLLAASTGTPQSYRVFGSTLEVYPYPVVATTVRVEYPVAAALLATDSDSPVFPAQYHRCLVDHALASARLDDGAESMADRLMGRFSRTLEQMKQDLLTVRGDSYPTIQDVSW